MGEWDYDCGLGLANPAPNAQPLDRTEAMLLLASVEYGRVVFSCNALPAIRPVNHLVDDGRIILRTRLTSAISAAVRSTDGIVVAYEADNMDVRTRAGWSVVVTGSTHTVMDPQQISRYERLLHPWVNHADTVVAIQPGVITGFRISAHTQPASSGG